MLRCDAFQDQMLEYAYDLFEEAERQTFLDHLPGCPACQAALVKVQQKQNLLAAAARMEFPEVQFALPSDTSLDRPVVGQPAATSAVPAVLPLARPKLARPTWRRWAVAAALVLLALGGLGGPGYFLARDYGQVQVAVQTGEARVAEARNRIHATEDAAREARRLRDARLAQVDHNVREGQLKVVVTGPGVVQLGAPNGYQIDTLNLNDQPTPAEVTVRLANKQGQLSDPLQVDPAGDRGHYRVILPPDLPVKPDNNLTLVVHARRASGSQMVLREELALAQPVYLTHLTTDRPVYHPGETVFFRSLTLERFSLKPAEEDFHYEFSLTYPNGEDLPFLGGAGLVREDPQTRTRSQVIGPDHQPVRGVAAGSYTLDPKTPPGDYVLSVRDLDERFPMQQRRLRVDAPVRNPLLAQLQLERKAYRAGEIVEGRARALRPESGPVANKAVEAAIQVDDQLYGADGKKVGKPLSLQTDADGSFGIRFKLPAEIEKGQGSVALTFRDGEQAETIVKSIPIAVNKLQLQFFPEGGYLVAGLVNRVYFQASTPTGKPADVKGRLLENGKPLGVEVQTLSDRFEPGVNQGLGHFQFKPRTGHIYTVRIDKPAGISEHFRLPEVQADGVVLYTPEGVVKPGKPIRVLVRSSRDRPLMVGAYCRGRLLDSVQLARGQTEALLKPNGGEGGVCRITVFEELPSTGQRRDLQPVAERLIYRQPAERLKLAIKPDRPDCAPGQTISLSLESATESDRAAPAIAMVAVVDCRALADEKAAPGMPTHFLLTTEVRNPEDLEDADFLLGPHPLAAETLDLLLGTQGWRRFAEQNPEEFRRRHKEEAERLLVASGQSTTRVTDLVQEKISRVKQEFAQQIEKLTAEYQQARMEIEEASEEGTYKSAVVRLEGYQRGLEQLRVTAMPILAAVLVVIALFSLFLALTRELRRAAPYYAAVAVCAGFLVVVASLTRPWEQQPVGHPEPQFAQVNKNWGLDREPDTLPAPANLPGGTAATPLPQPETAAMSPMPPLAPPRTAGNNIGREDGKGKRTAPPAPLGGPADKNTDADSSHTLKEIKEAQVRTPAATVPPFTGSGPAAAPRPSPVPQNVAPALASSENLKKQSDKPGMMARGQTNGIVVPFEEARQDLLEKAGAAADEKTKALDRAVQQKTDQTADNARRLGGLRNREVEAGLGGGRSGSTKGSMNLDQLRNGGANSEGKQTALVFREYARQRPAGTLQSPQVPQTETLYWHPVLVLPDGKGKMSFDLGSSTTRYQVTVFAHTLDGRIGAATLIVGTQPAAKK